MQIDEAINLLRQYGQEHILQHWDTLSAKQKENLLDQLSRFRFSRWIEQQQLLHAAKTLSTQTLLPFVNPTQPDSIVRRDKGQNAIATGKVGCVILAGGQGSRLRFRGPKGCFPLTPFRQRSLFQMQAEKIVAAEKQMGRTFFVAIMTSSLNHEETKQFFAKHNGFGLNPKNLFFFQQTDLPYLDEQGNLFLQAPDTIAEGPDGNGSFFSSFVESGLLEEWVQEGIRYLHVFPIDNPLIDPLDSELIGLMEERGDDVTLLAVEKKQPEEKVGLLVQQEGKVRICEYFEIPPEQRREREADGQLTFRCANISVFAIALDFVLRVAQEDPLPLHKAKKNLPTFFPNDLFIAAERIGWKFETFWFDSLPFSLQTSALLRDREQCFAPLKSVSGEGGILQVQEALEKKEKRILEAQTGLSAPEEPIELSASFYYPTPEWSKKWEGRLIQEGGFLT